MHNIFLMQVINWKYELYCLLVPLFLHEVSINIVPPLSEK